MGSVINKNSTWECRICRIQLINHHVVLYFHIFNWCYLRNNVSNINKKKLKQCRIFHIWHFFPEVRNWDQKWYLTMLIMQWKDLNLLCSGKSFLVFIICFYWKYKNQWFNSTIEKPFWVIQRCWWSLVKRFNKFIWRKILNKNNLYTTCFNPFLYKCWKMAKHTLKNTARSIVSLAIFSHYVW